MSPRVTKKEMSYVSPLQFGRPDNGWRPTELPQLRDGERIGFDYEYEPHDDPTRYKPFSFSFYCPERKQGWYVPWGHRGGGNLDEAACRRWFADNMRGRHFYSLNAKAEMHSTYCWGFDPNELGMVPHDVAFPPTLLNEHRYDGFSLEALAEEYLPEHERKVHPVGLDPDKFMVGHAGELQERCISDSYLAWRLYEVTKPMIDAENLGRVNQIEDDCIPAVVHMERVGVRIDRTKMERWISEIDERVAEKAKYVYDMTKVRLINDGPHVMSDLFYSRGIEEPIVFNEYMKQYEQSWSADGIKATIKELGDSTNGKVIQAAFDVRRLRGLKSKYFTKWLKALGAGDLLRFPLHQLRSTKDEGSDEAFGTCTGRFSSGGNEFKINIQQFMKCEKQIETMGDEFIVRELVIPEDELDCFASDASQIEFRLFSHYAALIGYPATANAYAKNPMEDFHMLVTILMNPGIDNKIKLKALRKHMKHNNFGVLYGMGRAKLARRLELACICTCDWNERDLETNRKVRYFGKNEYHELSCPARKANDIMDEYDGKFPEARKLLMMASDRAKERGFVTDIVDRRGRFPDGQSLHKALNKIIQGGAASYFKIKLAELWRERKTLEINLRAPIHDEFLGDIIRGVERRKQLQDFLDTQSLPLRVPLLWESGFGANWREANGQ